MLRTATLSAVLLLTPLAARAEITLSGFMQQNTSFNTAGQNPDGRHKPCSAAHLRYASSMP